MRREAAAAVALAALNVFWRRRPRLRCRERRPRLLLVNVEVGNERTDDLVELVREARPDVTGVTELDSSQSVWDAGLSSPTDGYGSGVNPRTRAPAGR